MLTEKQRKILSGELTVSPNYVRSIMSKKRRQIARIMEDFKFLAKHHPELFNLEDFKQIIALILKRGEITTDERYVRGVVFEGKRKKGKFVKIGGGLYAKRHTPYVKHKGPLKKPEIYRNLVFSYELIKIIHREIAKLSPLEHARDVVEFIFSRKGKIKIKVESLDCWIRDKTKARNLKIVAITE